MTPDTPYVRRERGPAQGFRLGPEQVHADIAEAYAAVAAVMDEAPDRWTGWKLGGTNHGRNVGPLLGLGSTATT